MVLKYNIRVARTLGSAIRGRTEVLRRFRAELEGRQRRERIVLRVLTRLVLKYTLRARLEPSDAHEGSL